MHATAGIDSHACVHDTLHMCKPPLQSDTQDLVYSCFSCDLALQHALRCSTRQECQACVAVLSR